ncbi:MAG: lysylphosphatidylglycerol synthase transmembrane domain-containing protein [Melioribacteraceae bacterium]
MYSNPNKNDKIDKKSNILKNFGEFLRKKILLILISSLLLYFLLVDVQLHEIFHSLKTADLILLLLAFSLHAVGYTISAVRWKILLKSQKVYSKISFLIKSYLVATFFNHFIPSTIGGDSVRAFDSYKLGNNKAKGIAVIFVDRFLGLLALFIFVILSTLFSVEISFLIPNLDLMILVSLLIILLIILFIFNPPLKLFRNLSEKKNKITRKIGILLLKLSEAFGHFRNKKGQLFQALLLSFLLQANIIVYYYIISKALGFDIHILNFSLIIPVTIFITMFPLSVNGIGIRENILFFFFSFFGITKSQAIAYAWIEFGMLLLLGVVGGIIYITRNTNTLIKSEQ